MNKTKERENCISLGEICYLLFFGLLLLAKGIGLYDGQGWFKLFLMAALGCWALKMCLTRWTWKEAIVAGGLVVWGGVVYLSSGEKAALISIMTIVGMKDVSVKRVFRVGLVIWTACFFGMLTLSLTGVIEPLLLVHDKAGLGYVIRNALGYTHPNVLHISYVILIAFWFYSFGWEKKMVLWPILVAFVGNLYVFLYSLSYTGFAMTMAYLILILYFSLRQEPTKAERFVIQCLMPICVLTAIFAPLLLQGQAFEIADKIVNWRFRLTRRYLTLDNLSLLGTPVLMEAGSIDCSYVYCLIYYGIPLFLLFMIGYFFLIRHLLKGKRNEALALVLGLVAAGFTEPFMFNFSYKNLILFFLGEYLYELLRGGKIEILQREICIFPKWTEKCCMFSIQNNCGAADVWKRVGQTAAKGKKGILAACLIGAILGAFWGMSLETKPYVIVNKRQSDRVGGRYDYQIFEELPEEIVENALIINCPTPDTQVYVFEGDTIEMEEFRKVVSGAVAGGLLAGALGYVIIGCIYGRLKKENKSVASK